VHVEVLGTKAMGGGGPMRRDTLFRISSMTKPVAAAAALLLFEESKLRLDEPLTRLLPELANRKVLQRLDGPLDETVPAKRDVTLRDLLTCRMGFGVIWGPQEAHPIQRAAAKLGLVAFGPPQPRAQPAPDEWLRRFATLPLMHQPGERWMYNTGFELLTVLLTRAAGQPLDVFLKERLFEPLGMEDTSFFVPAKKLDRLPPSYWSKPTTGALELYDEAAGGQWSRPPAFPSASAGLVSTVDDYLAFARLLLSKGKHGDKRILSRLSVETMTTDQLTPAEKAASTDSLAPGFWDNRGWGFGVAIINKRDDVSSVPGRYGWDGGLGTSWSSDPTEDLVGILMTQVSAYPAYSSVYLDFWTQAYLAMED
jgi:CubicO group peptidase (beta-lactamase class C family)